MEGGHFNIYPSSSTTESQEVTEDITLDTPQEKVLEAWEIEKIVEHLAEKHKDVGYTRGKLINSLFKTGQVKSEAKGKLEKICEKELNMSNITAVQSEQIREILLRYMERLGYNRKKIEDRGNQKNDTRKRRCFLLRLLER